MEIVKINLLQEVAHDHFTPQMQQIHMNEHKDQIKHGHDIKFIRFVAKCVCLSEC